MLADSEQHVVDAVRQLALVDARAHGGIALRVEVDHEHALAHLGQAGGQVDGGRGLADAAFLVGHAEDPRHDGSWCLLRAQADAEADEEDAGQAFEQLRAPGGGARAPCALTAWRKRTGRGSTPR
jgi:hypothetical protein